MSKEEVCLLAMMEYLAPRSGKRVYNHMTHARATPTASDATGLELATGTVLHASSLCLSLQDDPPADEP